MNLMKTCQVKINCHVAFSENKAAEKTTAQYMLRHPIEFKANCLVSFVLLIPVTICCLHAVHSSLQYSGEILQPKSCMDSLKVVLIHKYM